ncbi:MAG: ABC transporter permease subunit [Aerococcaceae bacterium]|nr:ABC transporter permease subunit [Aerococcaceae bacterium]
MINLVKAECYQLTQRKSARAWFVAAVVLGLFSAILPDIVAHFSDLPKFSTQVKTVLFAESIINTAVFLLLSIVGTAFNHELKNRTLVNSISYGFSRKQIYLSKLIGAVIMTAVFVILAILTFGIVVPLISGGSSLAVWADLAPIFKYVPIWLAYLGLYVWIAFLSESNTPTYIMLALIVFVFPVAFQLGQSYDISWIQAIEPYFLTQLNPDRTINLFGINAAPFIALAYLIGFTLFGIHLFNKKEIK